MLKMYTAEFCPNCRKIKNWFPNEFQYVSVDDWGHTEIEAAGITAIPTVEFEDGRKIYAGAMGKRELDKLLEENNVR